MSRGENINSEQKEEENSFIDMKSLQFAEMDASTFKHNIDI